MIIDAALCAMSLAAVWRRRRPAALVFVLVTMTFDVLSRPLDGFAYYGAAAIASAATGYALTRLEPSRMGVRLAEVCFLSACLNALGYVYWYLYQPPLAYNTAFVILYAYCAFVIVTADRRKGDGFLGYYRACSVFPFDSSCRSRTRVGVGNKSEV